MVYRKRRTYRRKRSYRRRRFSSKYRRGYRRSGSNKIYYFTRFQAQSDSGDAFLISNVLPTYDHLSFSLNKVSGYTEFTALYDMYKINAVKVTFLPQQTMNNSLSLVNNAEASARFYSAIDRNDVNDVATMNEIREYKSCKFTPILRPHKRFIMKPKILDRGGTYTPGNPWIKCDSPEQVYYGLKIAVEPMLSSLSANMTYTIEVKYYLAFKNVK